MKLPKCSPLRLGMFALVVAFLGTFQAGYHIALINNPQGILVSFINASYVHHYGRAPSSEGLTMLWAVTVSSVTVTSIAGSLSSSFFAERFGRKFILFVVTNVGAIVANLCMGGAIFATSFELLIAGRLLIGYVFGVQLSVLAVYLSECSPTRFRGVVGAFQNQLLCVIALIAIVVTLPHVAIDVERSIAYLLSAGVVPATVQLLLYPVFPESPKHLLLSERDPKRAKQSIVFYYGREVDTDKVFSEFYKEEECSSREQLSFIEVFRRPEIRRGVILSIVANVAMVATGFMVIFQFSSQMFKKAGFDEDRSTQMTLIIVAAHTVSAILITPFMDSVKRRNLLLATLIVDSACNVVFVVFSNINASGSWTGVVSVSAFFVNVVAFSVGPGPITWFVTAELTPQCARSVAMSLATTVNSFVMFVVSLVYPPFVVAVGTYSMLGMVVASIPCILWLYLYLPETRNRRVDEILAHWKARESIDVLKQS